jgi:2-polyprenyl-3-methyl-5-hydroxy-6-metoxy-1,4-benzoquinol methylase
MSPLCESFLCPEQLDQAESFYPLHAKVCHHCFLVQLEAYVAGEDIFTEYAYFSSYSDSWLEHAQRYTEQMIEQLGLHAGSQVVEVASNDGYLLQNFVQHGIPALGIEPAANVARVAVTKGIPTLVEFFGRDSARRLVAEGTRADLLVGNNVMAHVPDINDFVAGLKLLLAPAGTITLEFPHLVQLVANNQFDTIYHEHYSYFSFTTARRILAAHGLVMYDVEELPTHGGSLRVYARHAEHLAMPVSARARDLVARERSDGICDLDYYGSFATRVQRTKHMLLDFLLDAKRRGCTVVGYGAPGKGNTLLNFGAIRSDFLEYTVDRNPYKHGRFTPGTRIPILPTERIRETRPDYVLILPWNLKDEIMTQHDYIREWDGRFVTPIPEPRVWG